MMTLEKFEEASELVKKVTTPTKLMYSEVLSEQTGAKVYLKPENMQVTGAYKIRGAYYKIHTLTQEEKKGTYYGIRRKPCSGCSVRGKSIRLQSSDRNANDNPFDQGESYQGFRCRSDTLRRCL